MGEPTLIWKPEQLLADRYQIGGCLKQSGTCCLYRASDVFRNMPQLILGPGPRSLASAENLQWFDGYCRSVLAVPPHVNVLSPRRIDRHGEIPFLVMRHADGVFWDDAIQEDLLTELSKMLDVALQVARGVAWLHAHGHLHYNVKPANVLITEAGVAKVWKYGEAVAKTRVYASPEQLAGKSVLTPATDIWSWAVSVLHMFVGKVTWRSGDEAPAILERYVQGGPAKPALPHMPAEFAELIGSCLKENPDERPGTMNEVSAQVEAILAFAVPGHVPSSNPGDSSTLAPRVKAATEPDAPPELEGPEDEETVEAPSGESTVSAPSSAGPVGPASQRRRRRDDPDHWGFDAG